MTQLKIINTTLTLTLIQAASIWDFYSFRLCPHIFIYSICLSNLMNKRIRIAITLTCTPYTCLCYVARQHVQVRTVCLWSYVVKGCSDVTSEVDGDVISVMSQESVVVFVNIGRLTAGNTFVSLYVTYVSVHQG